MARHDRRSRGRLLMDVIVIGIEIREVLKRL